MNHAIGFGPQHDNGEREPLSAILLWEPFINRHEPIKHSRVGDKAKKFAVADARPPDLRHSLDDMTGQFPRQVLRQALERRMRIQAEATRRALPSSRKATAWLRDTVG